MVSCRKIHIFRLCVTLYDVMFDLLKGNSDSEIDLSECLHQNIRKNFGNDTDGDEYIKDKYSDLLTMVIHNEAKRKHFKNLTSNSIGNIVRKTLILFLCRNTDITGCLNRISESVEYRETEQEIKDIIRNFAGINQKINRIVYYDKQYRKFFINTENNKKKTIEFIYRNSILLKCKSIIPLRTVYCYYVNELKESEKFIYHTLVCYMFADEIDKCLLNLSTDYEKQKNIINLFVDYSNNFEYIYNSTVKSSGKRIEALKKYISHNTNNGKTC